MSDQKKLSAREYLKQLEVLDMQINDDIATLSDMKMNVCSAGGIDYSRDKVQTSPVGDKLCKDVVRYTMFDQHINEEIDQFVDAKKQIIKEIRGLRDKNMIQILTKVYVQFKTVKVASQEMKKSYSYTVELHNKALSAFEDTYKTNYFIFDKYKLTFYSVCCTKIFAGNLLLPANFLCKIILLIVLCAARVLKPPTLQHFLL